MPKWEVVMYVLVVLGVRVRVLNTNGVCFDKSGYLFMFT